jgi:2-methylcitrate dehydratase PrpD
VGPEARWTARVRVELTDGSVEEIERRHPWGGLEQPMTNDDAVVKYRRMAARVMNGARAQHIQQLVQNLEELDDVQELVDGLADPVSSPFDRS